MLRILSSRDNMIDFLSSMKDQSLHMKYITTYIAKKANVSEFNDETDEHDIRFCDGCDMNYILLPSGCEYDQCEVCGSEFCHACFDKYCNKKKCLNCNDEYDACDHCLCKKFCSSLCQRVYDVENKNEIT